MRKLYSLLPDDWFFKIVTTYLTTTFGFYLFDFCFGINWIQEIWSKDKHYYIYTFLIIQFCTGIFFYFLIFWGLKRLLFSTIQKKIEFIMAENKTIGDLKAISEIKLAIIDFFSLTKRIGIFEEDDLTEEIDHNEAHFELTELISKIIKWSCLFIHLGVTSVLVFKLSAYYIIPLLVITLIAIAFFVIGVYFLIANINLIEKARKASVRKSSKNNHQ